MSQLIHIDKDYQQWIATLGQQFKQGQIKAAIHINSERISFYWTIGKDIVERQLEKRYGESIIRSISQDLQKELPNVSGLTPQNIYYCKKFYITYSQAFEKIHQVEGKSVLTIHSQHAVEIFPQVEGKFPLPIFAIPWGHHKVLMDKSFTSSEELIFYVNKIFENSWSRAVLQNMIKADLYHKQGHAITNFSATLPLPSGDLAQSLIKDPLNLDFLTLKEHYDEKQLKDALLRHIGKLLMELGTGFAYMGREYLLEVAGKEQFSDMLFYNTRLHAYVVVELKVTDFDSRDLGQLSGYMSLVNHVLKTDIDNPTMGLLICMEKNNTYAQYCLEGYNQPIAITAYDGIQVLPNNFNDSLPTQADIEKDISRL